MEAEWQQSRMMLDRGIWWEPAQWHKEGRDRHAQGSRLSQVILGGQDGLVNTLGVVLGVAAASESRAVVLAGGLAAALAESVSMAAVGWTSARADAEYAQSEAQRERRHLKLVPEIEREEIREIYESRGFEGEQLQRIVDTITRNPDVWIDVMLAEELRVNVDSTPREAVKSSLLIFAAALIGSLVPLLPFFFWDPVVSIYIALGLSAVALFALGVAKNQIMGIGRLLKGGLELMLIGVVSALLGWGVGALFNAFYPSEAPGMALNCTA